MFTGIVEETGRVTQISTREVLSMVNDFQHRSEVYRATGGVHSAALCDTENILVFNEDIGRHNAIDKIFGECVLKDIATDGGIIVTVAESPRRYYSR